jgi:hypothetical protein
MKLREIEKVSVIAEVEEVEELEEAQEVVSLVDQYCPVAKNYDRRRMERFPVEKNNRSLFLTIILITN